MARRIINKACNDLVGGTDVSVNLGAEIPRKPSVLKLATRDPNPGIRQAVDVKAIDGRPMPKGPLQIVHPSRRNNVKPEEKGGKPHFVHIDGDGSVTQVDAPSVQQPRAGPQTAYKMRSFMSSVAPRGHSRSPAKPSNPPPRKEPNVPKASRQPGDVKMFLPKGIHKTDQPYVLPKFMPTYREMMAPKPKPDPLVSIVETTPPSLQKWAVEWNAEPKKTISIDELKEDLIREATEKSHKLLKPQQVSLIHEPNTDELHDNRKPDVPNNDLKSHSSYAEPLAKTHPNASASGKPSPWEDLHVPTSYETRMENQGLGNPDPQQQKIGRPLVDWVPLKYSSLTKHSNNPRDTKYSFQEAINNGAPKKTTKTETGKSKLFFAKPAEDSVYYDTEEQKFHDWFKERMAAAAQSAANRPKATLKNNHLQFQAPQSDLTFSGAKDPSKSVSMTSANPIGQPKLAQHSPMNPSNRWKDLDSAIPCEKVANPKLTNDAPVNSYEPESNSSFYHWLKLRGHRLAKNDPNPPENKKEKEKPNLLPQNVPLFPWSVPYTLRKRVSTPTPIPKRLSTPTAGTTRPVTAKNIKKSPKSVSQGDMTLRRGKSSIRKSGNSIGRKSIIKADKKLHKTDDEWFVKRAGKKPLKSNSKVNTKNIIKKMPKAELSRAPNASLEHSWLNDSWNIDSEVDHVNNLRKMEVLGNSPRAANMKKLYPSMGGEQMKYWESKYGKKPQSPQNQKVPQGVDSQRKTNSYNWYMPQKATNRADNVFKEVTVENADNPTGRDDKRSNFSTIDERSNSPLNISQNAKGEVMDFSEEFDVDNFLYKEEAAEKELTKATIAQQENKVEEDGKTKDEQHAKVKGKEHIKFPRTVKAHTEASKDVDLNKRVQQKLDEDEFILALGEDPGQEDLEWSEFIGPKNNSDHDSDLTRLVGAQARQLGALRHSCL